MYQSRYEVERKLKQINYIFNELKMFQNRVFVNNGRDAATGCYPIEIKLSSFLIFCRSIFQYALEEIGADNTKRKKFDDYINQHKIIGHFKDLRDSEIHNLVINTHTTITLNSSIKSIDQSTGQVEAEEVGFYVESLEDLYSKELKNPEAKFVHEIATRVQITDELLLELEADGKIDLVETAKKNKQLFEIKSYDGTSDLFELCSVYRDNIKSFVDFGIKEQFIT